MDILVWLPQSGGCLKLVCTKETKKIVSFIFRIFIFVVHYCTHLPFYLEVNFHQVSGHLKKLCM
jgi:hypothetical protein